MSERALSAVVGWGLAATVVIAPLAIGGTRPAIKVALCGVALVLLMLAAYDRLGRGLQIPWPLWAPIAVVGLIALQLVPLPLSFHEMINGAGYAARERVLTDFGAFEGAWPLSLDPNATWIGLFLQLSFVAIAIVAANLRGQHRTTLVYAIVLGGALISVIGLAHWAFRADRILWSYSALDRGRMGGYFSTFVNNNTLAGYLTLAALVGLGLFARARRELDQRVGLGGALLCIAGVVLAGSRGGHVAIAVGAIALFILAHARTSADDANKRAQLVSRVGLLVVVVGVAAAITLLPDWHPNPWDTPETDGKVAAWGAAVEYAKAYPWTGSGRDTFAFVYPHYQEVLVRGSVSHPENIVLQLTTEMGYVGAAVALLGGVFALFVVARGRRDDPLQWGLVAALAAVGIQQIVDFGFESAGLALPVAAVMGLGLGRANPGKPSQKLAIAALVGALLAGGALAWRGPSATLNSADAAAAAIAKAPVEKLDATIRDAALRHPADYVIALAAADRMARIEPPRVSDTLRWLNRAMAAFPHGSQANVLAARYLIKVGRPGQAAGEYRRAITQAPWREPLLLTEAANVLQSPRHLEMMLPDTPTALPRLGSLLLSANRPNAARQVTEGLILFKADDPDAHTVLGRACYALRDEVCAERQAKWLIDNKRPGAGFALQAQLAARRGDHDNARAALTAASAASENDIVYLRMAARIYAKIGDYADARRVLDRLWRMVAADNEEAAVALSMRGQVEQQAGENEAAFRAFAQAFERHPRLNWGVQAAGLAAKSGHPEEARRLAKAVHARWPDDPKTKALLSNLDGD